INKVNHGFYFASSRLGVYRIFPLTKPAGVGDAGNGLQAVEQSGELVEVFDLNGQSDIHFVAGLGVLGVHAGDVDFLGGQQGADVLDQFTTIPGVDDNP